MIYIIYKKIILRSKVLLASLSSNFSDQSSYTQIHDVTEIIIQDSYLDQQGNYGSDIAILILKKSAKLGPDVLPACIDWQGKFEISKRVGDIAIISGNRTIF